jgi:hypothetical protein
MNDAKYNQARQLKLLTGLWSDGRLLVALWLLSTQPAFGKHRGRFAIFELRQSFLPQ